MMNSYPAVYILLETRTIAPYDLVQEFCRVTFDFEEAEAWEDSDPLGDRTYEIVYTSMPSATAETWFGKV